MGHCFFICWYWVGLDDLGVNILYVYRSGQFPYFKLFMKLDLKDTVFSVMS